MGVFSCSIAYYDGEKMLTVRGDIPGTIVAPRGSEGFGFDITFVPDGETQTYAEMDSEKRILLAIGAKLYSCSQKDLTNYRFVSLYLL